MAKGREEVEDMEVQQDSNQQSDDSSSAMTSAPVVFRPEDYGPVEIPEALQSVATYEPDGPRLMITQIVNENFKSYAGVQTLGPFHRNFTAIIGPNGSGKSNVIDSMLFVFGYRANKIRSKKISVLIHNSEKHQNINSCSVAVHFQKIIDNGLGDDEYTVVPNSQFVVSRMAYKDNSSSYYLNGKKSPYKEIAQVLRGCGIDLDHNRFLILQGEVEQIAMMKPKALTEHEDGMLEFLEDIIGSNRFKEPIDLLSQRVETLSDLRAEKLKRVKAVEKEMENLDGPRQEALEFLKTENNLMVLKNKLFQKYLMECTQHETKAQAEKDRITEDMKEFDDKRKEVEKQKREKMKECEQLKKEHKKLLKGCEESKEKFSDMECQDAKCREELKLNNAKIKKLEKNFENETIKIDELKVVPEMAEKSCNNLKKQLENLEKSKSKEEENEKEIMDSLKDETQDLQAEKDLKEAKLLEKQGELNEKKSKLQVSESELELYTAREQAESKKMTNLQKSLKDAEAALEKREEDISKIDGYIPTVQGNITNSKAELKQMLTNEKQCEEKRRSLQIKVEEVKSSMASSKSKNRILDALMGEKERGNIPGIYGRLGDLGAIDAQYDVAISTACRALDNIVVDSVNTGKKCVEFLKRNNIGQATFILLEKMEVWRNETKKKITTPENVPRLFDLVRVPDETLRTCFYFALRNTLVAKDIDQASRVAYGRQRFRVVTLKGELIEMSGAMSGGGSSVCKGKMGQSVAATDVDPKEIVNMENSLEKLNKEWQNFQHNKVRLEDSIQQNEKDLVTMKHNLKKHTVDVEGLKERRKSLESQIKDQELVLQSATPDQEKLTGLKKLVQECRKAFEKVSETTTKLEKDVKELHNQILDKGKAKLAACLCRLKAINNNIDQVTGQITKTTVGVKTSQRNLKRSEEKAASLKEEIAETKQLIETLTGRLKEIEGEAKNLLELYERAQADVKDKEEKLTGMAEDLEQWEKQEAELAKEGMEFKHEMEKWDGMLKENKQKRKHWEKELTCLKLTPIDEAERTEEDLTLPTHTPEELQALSKQDVQVEITVQEEHLAKMKPNMAAIADFKKKEELYLTRVGELDQITNFRNEQRSYHDGLRKQRLEEFMQGFQVITNKLKEMYQMITLGGDAELELVDSLDPFSEGIVFSVRPPKKSWKNISNLSGGEKTLSSLALVFALHHFKPTPLYVMDEIDAALDFKNVSIVANYIKERTKNAQFIIISLRNNMFELADRLVGIYKTHDSTKSVTLNPWKLSQGFAEVIREIHNIDIDSSVA